MHVIRNISISVIILVVVVIIYFNYRKREIVEDLTKNTQENRNIEAILKVIRWAEGTLNSRGYNTIYGYKYFDDYSKHPNRVVCSGGYCSSAAGAYQFLYSTWIEEKIKNGLQDFSPQSQDIAAVSRLKFRGSYNLIKQGKILNALDKISWEWASLPASNGRGRYGQPIRTVQEVLNKFKEFGGQVA